MNVSRAVVSLAIAGVAAAALAAGWPEAAWAIDPFLVAVFFAAFHGNPSATILIAVVAGWIQDVQFGGPVVGISGLSKLVVGYGLAVAGERFVLAAHGPRLVSLAVAAGLDGLLVERIAEIFGLPSAELSLPQVGIRSCLTATVGVLTLDLASRLPREKRP